MRNSKLVPQIIIDSGHGGKDWGGGSNEYWSEKEKVLEISLYQYERFKELGIRASLVRDKDTYLEAIPRTNIIKKNGAKLCISNHINSYSDEKVKGSEIAVSVYSNKKWANLALDNLVENGATKRRVFTRTFKDGKTDYYFMHRLTGSVETIIVEYGFATNKDDSQKILKDWKKYAEAVVKATCIYMGVKYTKDSKPEIPLTSKIYYKLGDRGSDVKELQTNLVKLGYNIGSYGADGIFGRDTDVAIRKFQSANSLVVDGIAGTATLSKINTIMANFDRNFKSTYMEVGNAKVIRTTQDNIGIKVLGDTLHDANVFGINLQFYPMPTKKEPYTYLDPNSVWGIATNNGKAIGGNSMLVNYRGTKRGTIIGYADSTVGYQKVNSINEFIKPHIWAASGYTVLPKMDFKGEEMGPGINYRTAHTYIGHDAKGYIYMIVMGNHMIQEITTVAKQLGLTHMISVDGGGSSQLNHPMGSFRSYRKVNSIMYIKEI